jgi:predicted nucleotidyltransferase
MTTAIQRAEVFSRQVVDAYGAAVIAVVLYGSAARGEYREGLSDLNVLVLLTEADAASLRKGSALAREWVKAGNAPPLVMSEEEWRRSSDVFPIEYADMRDAHRLLYGRDPFTGLEIRREDLRLQCERELKAKQIQLREHYMLSAGEPAELGTLLQRSFPTFLVLFRTVLRLLDEAVPAEPAEVLALVGRKVGFDAAPLGEILRARQAGETLSPQATDPRVVAYLEAVSRTVGFVDQLEPGA